MINTTLFKYLETNRVNMHAFVDDIGHLVPKY